jgi:hypothetical protein
MFDPILLAALLTTVLLGGALFRVLRSERRRANLEPLLSTIAMTARSADVQSSHYGDLGCSATRCRLCCQAGTVNLGSAD